MGAFDINQSFSMSVTEKSSTESAAATEPNKLMQCFQNTVVPRSIVSTPVQKASKHTCANSSLSLFSANSTGNSVKPQAYTCTKASLFCFFFHINSVGLPISSLSKKE